MLESSTAQTTFEKMVSVNSCQTTENLDSTFSRDAAI